ncbi:non-catalytic module family expn protein [Moniliophthora roreri]|nr:non-catalytic module family expn protein [Moniliophthora roreri]
MHLSTVLLSTLLASIELVNAFNGDATWYQPNGNYGACGWKLSNSDMVVALPSGKYANGSKCRKHINVHYKSKSVNVVVADLCPGCGPNDVDLSEGAFKKLAGLDVGRMKVNWDFSGGLQLLDDEDDMPVDAKITGDATWYQPNGGYGACGAPSKNSDLVVALPQGHSENSPSQDKYVDVTVVDLCPGCGPNDIDLSEGAFKKLASLGTGRIKVTWNVQGGIQLLDDTEFAVEEQEDAEEAYAVGFPHTSSFTGDATWYQPNGGFGACGWKLSNSDMVVALPSGKYANGSKCRKHINVHYKSKSVNVVVADLCPGCGPNDVDLSEGAFKKLAGLDVGRMKVNWDFSGGLQLLDDDEDDMPVDAKTTGDATWYQPNGGFGACGARSSNSDLVVALPQGHYANGSKCWKHLGVHYRDKYVDVTVVDLCPGCGPNDIDLSEGAFQRLAGLDVGRIKVTWEVNGGLRLIEQDNDY